MKSTKVFVGILIFFTYVLSVNMVTNATAGPRGRAHVYVFDGSVENCYLISERDASPLSRIDIHPALNPEREYVLPYVFPHHYVNACDVLEHFEDMKAYTEWVMAEAHSVVEKIQECRDELIVRYEVLRDFIAAHAPEDDIVCEELVASIVALEMNGDWFSPWDEWNLRRGGIHDSCRILTSDLEGLELAFRLLYEYHTMCRQALRDITSIEIRAHDDLEEQGWVNPRCYPDLMRRSIDREAEDFRDSAMRKFSFMRWVSEYVSDRELIQSFCRDCGERGRIDGLLGLTPLPAGLVRGTLPDLTLASVAEWLKEPAPALADRLAQIPPYRVVSFVTWAKRPGIYVAVGPEYLQGPEVVIINVLELAEGVNPNNCQDPNLLDEQELFDLFNLFRATLSPSMPPGPYPPGPY